MTGGAMNMLVVPGKRFVCFLSEKCWTRWLVWRVGGPKLGLEYVLGRETLSRADGGRDEGHQASIKEGSLGSREFARCKLNRLLGGCWVLGAKWDRVVLDDGTKWGPIFRCLQATGQYQRRQLGMRIEHELKNRKTEDFISSHPDGQVLALSACDLTPTLHHLFVTRPVHGLRYPQSSTSSSRKWPIFPVRSESLHLMEGCEGEDGAWHLEHREPYLIAQSGDTVHWE